MRRAVITGATGVVGSALVRELILRGTEVLALLREESPNNRRLRAAVSDLPGSEELLKFRECSLDSLASFEDDASGRWDVFYHLGWTGTKGRERFDVRLHGKNVGYALDAVDLAARLGCRLFVGAGSQAEYGRTDRILTPETPACPENAYGAGKLAAGCATRIYAHEKGLAHIWTRILSVYGPNDGEKTLITYMVNRLLAGERPSTTRGEQIWDYLYSADAARALADIGDAGKDGRIYMIASGVSRPLRSYIEELRDVVRPGAEIGFGEMPYGSGQVMHLEADISGTVEDTGWRPEVSFAEGVRRMAEEAAARR